MISSLCEKKNNKWLPPSSTEGQLFFVGDHDCNCDCEHCYSTKKASNGQRHNGKYDHGSDGCHIVFNAHVILLTK